MSSKSFKTILIFISTIFLTEFIVAMITTNCPPGQYNVNNTRDEAVTNQSKVEPIEHENYCHNCSLNISRCDHCFFNLTNLKVICHNCTSGYSPSRNGDACLEDDGFPWWGALLIFLGIVGVIAGALVGYFYWKKQYRDNLPLPNTFPDPDGLNKGGRVKKKKFNKYTKDPTTSVKRIESAYGTKIEEKASVAYSNRNVDEANEPVEEVRVENEEVKVKNARVKVQPDKQREGSHLYENFGSTSGGKIRSHYPKSNDDDIYQNV